ncbi:hypothetical protein ACHAWF_004007, partial [Thalassiosira exigua]
LGGLGPSSDDVGGTAALEARARSLLASSIRTLGGGGEGGVGAGGGGGGTARLVYFAACSSGIADGAIESASSLIAARTLSKLGRSDLAWDFLRTLFGAQGKGGFVPRYAYLNRTERAAGAGGEEGTLAEGAGWERFAGPYPGPRLFEEAPRGRVPRSSCRGPDCEVGVWSSNAIAAMPFHATYVLEAFYLSNQTIEDVTALQGLYPKLWDWHTYLHGRIVAKCPGSGNGGVAFPCLPVRHPWETVAPLTSELWKSSLDDISAVIAKEGWTPGFEVPEAVKLSFDYPGDEEYEAALYLSRCLSEHGDKAEVTGKQSSHDDFRSPCPFSMMDVGFTAALSRSDKDLIQIIRILADKNRISRHSQEVEETAQTRADRSARMLSALWDEGSGTFLNRRFEFVPGDKSSGKERFYVSNNTTLVDLPLGTNFLGLWDRVGNTTRAGRTSSHLLRRKGKHAFDCGEYPLWSEGGCEEEASSREVLPSLNHLVSRGLGRNGAAGSERYLHTSTVNLVCGRPNADYSSDVVSPECIDDDRRFAVAFDAATALPLVDVGSNRSSCDAESPLVAAIVLDALVPDKPFRYESEPPISSSSVVFLIAAEMAVAFGVGLVCLVLSLNLMRRASADEEGDAFVRAMQEEREAEELLVHPPAADEVGEEEGTDRQRSSDGDGSSLGAWSLEMISSIPMKLWGGRQSHQQSQLD